MARSFVRASGQYLRMPNYPAFNDFVTYIGISMWIYIDSYTPASTNVLGVIKKTAPGANEFYCQIYDSGLYWPTFVNSSVWTIAETITGAWHHLFIDDDNTSGSRIFWDGTLKASNGGTGSRVISDSPIYIGGYTGGSETTDCRIAELAMWNGTDANRLTTGNISALAAGISPFEVNRKGLGIYAPLIRGINSDGTGDSNELFSGTAFEDVDTTGVATAVHPRIFYPAG